MGTEKQLKRGRGRPKSTDPRNIVVPVRFTKTEAKYMQAQADKKHLRLSEWMRSELLLCAPMPKGKWSQFSDRMHEEHPELVDLILKPTPPRP